MQCHVKLVFSNVGNRCADCHADIHRRQMGNNCEQCHIVEGWRELTANVNGHQNRFPLLGAHAATQCEDCHKSAAVGLFRGLSTDCAFCHINDYNTAKSIDHKAARFSTKCETCHRFDNWSQGFDHAATGFPLTGTHAQLECVQCHIGGNFSGTPADCVSCHLADFNSTTNPNHIAAGFPQDCALCHSTAAWTPAVFDHSKTKFPLTGEHTKLQCPDCHKNGQYVGLPTACVSCHLGDYKGATNPNHITAGFPQDCALCHSTAAWIPAVFDHSKTKFPLTGAHTKLQCPDCHKNGQYVGLPTACVSCHLGDYKGATNPNHITAGFPQDCAICHNATAWSPSTFDHSKTKFPLTGAHTSVQCTNCHIGGVYAGTPTDCYSCHSKEYNSTTDPNHVTAQFPKDCSQCHTTSSWSGATFNHTWFPIYTGTHRDKWTTCGDCHTNSNNYSVFSCITCHAHDKAPTDAEHRDVRNYVYNSTSCYACHPTGRGD
jgi:hypothetical protein